MSQTEKDKYHVKLLICGIKKKRIQINLSTEQRVTDVENKLMVIRGKGERQTERLGLADAVCVCVGGGCCVCLNH